MRVEITYSIDRSSMLKALTSLGFAIKKYPDEFEGKHKNCHVRISFRPRRTVIHVHRDCGILHTRRTTIMQGKELKKLVRMIIHAYRQMRIAHYESYVKPKRQLDRWD